MSKIYKLWEKGDRSAIWVQVYILIIAVTDITVEDNSDEEMEESVLFNGGLNRIVIIIVAINIKPMIIRTIICAGFLFILQSLPTIF